MKPAIAFCALLIASTLALADDWPAWRGPTGQGYSTEKNLPLEWSGVAKNEKNVKWKIKLADPGNSTPILWKDKIFLTIANKGGSVRSLICFDRADGKQLWKNDVNYPDKERNWTQDWYANASPSTDGERVIVSFGSAGMYCYDLAGKELWKRTDLGKWEHAFGNSCSPLLYNDLCILLCGPTDGKGNYLLAVNKKTGKNVWKKDEKPGGWGAWGTPTLTNIDGKDQLLYTSDFRFKSLDPKTGDNLWSCDGLTQYVYTSTLVRPATPGGDSAIGVAMSGYGGAGLAVKLGGKGDITKDRLWHHPKNIQRVGSGIIVGDHVYIVEENGTPHCYELATGKEVWQVKDRTVTTNWGSMVHADGRLYVLTRDGSTLVLAANPEYKLLAHNKLAAGESTNSSPAISNGEIFLRTNRHLWCISEKK